MFVNDTEKSTKTMTAKIVQCLEECVAQFCERISIQFNINKDDVMELWVKETSMASSIHAESALKYCNHQFTKGQRVGMICKQKISDNETKCSKHRAKKRATPSEEPHETTLNPSIVLEQEFKNLNFNLEHSDSSSDKDD